MAQLGFVRNSIGEESYVSDEVIVSRGGVRVPSCCATGCSGRRGVVRWHCSSRCSWGPPACRRCSRSVSAAWRAVDSRSDSRQASSVSGVRVNAISAGPVRTLAAAGIAGFKKMYNTFAELTPLRSSITIEDVAGAAVYLASDLSRQTTGETIYVDGGFNILGVPVPEE